MTQIQQVVKQLESEFKLDSQGKAFVSIRGAARLADVDESSVRAALRSAGQKPSKMAEFLIEQGLNAAELTEWTEAGIPDTALAFILEYYGYECQERYRTQQAKLCCRAFNSIGIRTWIQSSLSWEHSQSLSNDNLALTAQKAIAEAEVVTNWVVNSLGINETLGKLMKVDIVAKQLPHLEAELGQIKQFLGAADPQDTVGMNATQVGEHLSPKLKAKEVNELLESMGLQHKVDRVSTKTGKLKYFWQVTKKGEDYSTVHKVTNKDTEWNGSQIKWQKSVVELLQGQMSVSPC